MLLGNQLIYSDPAIWEVEFRNGAGSIPVGGNSVSTGEWIV